MRRSVGGCACVGRDHLGPDAHQRKRRERRGRHAANTRRQTRSGWHVGRRRRRRTSRRRRRQGQHRGNLPVAPLRPDRRCSATAIPISLSMASSPAATIPNRPIYKPMLGQGAAARHEHQHRGPGVHLSAARATARRPSRHILQTANDVVFLYAGGGASTQPADYRVIPTDGRKHDPVRSQDVLLRTLGRPLGGRHARDRVDRVQRSHLARARRGFHSDKMRVIERLRREGNTLHYEITVEDPEVLAQPWVMNPRQLRLNTNPNAFLPEGAAVPGLRSREHGDADSTLDFEAGSERTRPTWKDAGSGRTRPTWDKHANSKGPHHRSCSSHNRCRPFPRPRARSAAGTTGSLYTAARRRKI